MTALGDINPSASPKKRIKLPAFFLVLPSLLLSGFVIGYPIYDVLRMSVSKVSRFGKVQGFAWLDNFFKTFSDPIFLQSTTQTGIWTLCVVGGTILISIPIAILLNEEFHGRIVARTIILLPWAVSLAMTAVVWRFVVNGDFGMLNHTLSKFGLVEHNFPWLAYGHTAFGVEIFVGILVSMPFTVTILMGGLSAIPDTLYDAAKMDGSNGWQRFTNITFPLLQPFLKIAVVLNVIYVFNSFPIIWIMTNGGPANKTDILITYVYKQAFAFGKIGNAAAASVVMFLILLVFSTLYLYLTREQEGA